MAGNRAGGLLTAQRIKERNPNHYRDIGKIGGTKSRGGGFASNEVGDDGLTGRQRASVAGRVGGANGKRGKSKGEAWGDHERANSTSSGSNLSTTKLVTKNGKREAFVRGNAIVLQLTGGREAIIDCTDADLVAYSWSVTAQGYPCTNYLGKTQTLHRVVLERKLRRALKADEVTDHRNRDKFDNRRANLRAVSRRINAINTPLRLGTLSKYRGVSLNRKVNRWVAYIKVDGKAKHLGMFATEVEAAAAYNVAAKAQHGEYAQLNALSNGGDLDRKTSGFLAKFLKRQD